MLKKILTLCVAVGTLALTQVSNAYTLTFNGVNYGQNVNVTYGSTTSTFFAGQINMSFTGGAGTPAGYAQTFNAYCANIQNSLQSPMDVALRSTDDLTRNSISPNSGKKAAWLFNNYGGTIDSNTKGAALQIAIWEALYDSSSNLSDGYFKLNTSDAALTSQVNTYLTGLQNNYSATTATWFQPTNPSNSQDLIGQASSIVPEPGLLSLFAGTSMSGLMLLSRRRYRK